MILWPFLIYFSDWWILLCAVINVYVQQKVGYWIWILLSEDKSDDWMLGQISRILFSTFTQCKAFILSIICRHTAPYTKQWCSFNENKYLYCIYTVLRLPVMVKKHYLLALSSLWFISSMLASLKSKSWYATLLLSQIVI